MVALFFFTSFIYSLTTPAFQEFAKTSNGEAVYKVVFVPHCKTGHRNSGYAYAPGDFVVFKQREISGEAGPVCKNT